MKRAYPAEITKDEQGRYFVRFLDLPEAITEGESLQEALAKAQEVLALTLEARRAKGLPIPKAQPAAGENIHFIAPAAGGLDGFRDEFHFKWNPFCRRPLPKGTLEQIIAFVGEDQVAQVETLIAMSKGTDIKPMSPQKARPVLKEMREELDKIIPALQKIRAHPGISDWLFKGLETLACSEEHKGKLFNTLSAFSSRSLYEHCIRLRTLVSATSKVAEHGTTSKGSLKRYVVKELAGLVYLHNGSLHAPRLKGGGKPRSLLRELVVAINEAIPGTIDMAIVAKFTRHAEETGWSVKRITP